MNENLLSLIDNLGAIDKVESDYYFNGIKVPRVTKIISRCIHNEGLMYWANNLGFKHQSYRKTLDAAANIGTICHNNIDAYLKDNEHIPKGIDVFEEARNAYNSFKKWYSDISLYADVEVIYQEKPLICKYFGGTLDGFYRINGKNYIIDYKTSNHVTYNYCLQIAAYIYMLRETLGVNTDGAIILQLSKTSTGYNEFSLDFSNSIDKNYIEQCERAFLAMVYWYYNLYLVEEGFKSLGWD